MNRKAKKFIDEYKRHIHGIFRDIIITNKIEKDKNVIYARIFKGRIFIFRHYLDGYLSYTFPNNNFAGYAIFLNKKYNDYTKDGDNNDFTSVCYFKTTREIISCFNRSIKSGKKSTAQ